MAAKPRITISFGADGELSIWVNPEGRDLLVAELQHLSKSSDHFHLAVGEFSEVSLRDRPYRPGDQIVEAAKVLFRPDEWDQTYFPNVMEQDG